MPVRVDVERPDSVAEHRRREVRAITAVVLVVNGVAAACAIVPALNDMVTGLVLAVVAAVTGVLGLRWVLRRLRWWFEDRDDARTADAWRAEHPRTPAAVVAAERAEAV